MLSRNNNAYHYPSFSGEGNLIEEQTEIINKCEAPESGGESGAVPVMIIGNSNVFEVMHISKLSILVTQ